MLHTVKTFIWKAKNTPFSCVTDLEQFLQSVPLLHCDLRTPVWQMLKKHTKTHRPRVVSSWHHKSSKLTYKNTQCTATFLTETSHMQITMYFFPNNLFILEVMINYIIYYILYFFQLHHVSKPTFDKGSGCFDQNKLQSLLNSQRSVLKSRWLSDNINKCCKWVVALGCIKAKVHNSLAQTLKSWLSTDVLNIDYFRKVCSRCNLLSHVYADLYCDWPSGP